MTLKKKIAVGIGILLLGLGGGYGFFVYAFSASVAESFREQRVRNDAAKPLLDAVVTRKIKIGDTVDHAKQILTDAGLDFHFERFTPELRSIYRTGPGCGFTIVLALDSQERISKIDVRPFFTGP